MLVSTATLCLKREAKEVVPKGASVSTTDFVVRCYFICEVKTTCQAASVGKECVCELYWQQGTNLPSGCYLLSASWRS